MTVQDRMMMIRMRCFVPAHVCTFGCVNVCMSPCVFGGGCRHVRTSVCIFVHIMNACCHVCVWMRIANMYSRAHTTFTLFLLIEISRVFPEIFCRFSVMSGCRKVDIARRLLPCIHTYIHRNIQSWENASTLLFPYMYTYILTYIHAFMQTNKHTYAYRNMHTNLHKNTHTCDTYKHLNTHT